MSSPPLWLLLAIIPLAASVPHVDIDLIVIAHTHAQQWDEEFEAIKKALIDIFPTVFELGAEKSRVAIVYTNKEMVGVEGAQPWISTPLCDNNDDLISNISRITNGANARANDNSLHIATKLGFSTIMLARMMAEWPALTSRKRHVFFLASYLAGEPLVLSNDARFYLEKIRRGNMLNFHFYAIYQKRDNDPDQKNQLIPFTGLAENIYTTNNFVGGFNKTVFEWLKNKLIPDGLCKYEEACFFQDAERKECKMIPYTPAMTVDDGDCTATYNKPPPTASNKVCDAKQCNDTCKFLWPETTVTCNPEDCGKNKTLPIPYIQLEHCGRERVHPCPECPTTTTTTSTTPSPTPVPTPAPTQPAGEARSQVQMALIIAALAIVMIGGIGGEEE